MTKRTLLASTQKRSWRRRVYNPPVIGFPVGRDVRLRSLFLTALVFGALSFGSPALSQTTVPASLRMYGVPNGGRYDGANLVLRPDGSVWAASASENSVINLSADGKKVTRWTFPTDAAPSYLLPESDGTFWVAELGGFKVGRFNPETDELQEWVDLGRRPTGFAKRPDGKLWLPETNGWLSLFDPANGEFTYYKSTDGAPLVNLSYPLLESNGDLWVADFGVGYCGIVRFAPDASSAVKWKLPDEFTSIAKLIRGFDGAIWGSAYNSAQLIRLDPTTNEIKIYQLSGTAYPFDLLNYKDRIVYSDQGLGSIGFFDVRGAAPISTTIVTPAEVILTPSTALVAPSKRTLTKVELDVQTTADPQVTSGDRTDAAVEILTTQTFVWALALDEARGRIMFGAVGSIGSLLPPLVDSNDVVFPSAASISGVGGARWQTDMFLWNKGTPDSAGAKAAMTVTEQLHPSGWIAGMGASARPNVEVNNILLQEDVVGIAMSYPDLFGGFRLTASANPSDLFAGARVMRKREDGGTYGFFRNGVRAQQAFLVEEPGFFMTPSDVETQRTNVGFYVINDSKGEMTIVDSQGTTRASHPFEWPAGYHQQFATVFSQFGLPPLPNARIIFGLTKGRILPYGISLDNSTNDPADEPFFKSGHRAFNVKVLGAFHRSGPLGESARTDLQIFSAAGDATITAVFRPAIAADQAGTVPELPSITLEVPEKAVVEFQDILARFLGTTPGAGELELSANQPIYVLSRVSAPDPDGGRYGFALPGQVPDAVVPSSSKGVFIAATDSGWDVFQSDLYLTNPSDNPITVTLRATTYTGTAAGERGILLGPRETRYLEAAYFTISGFGAPVGRLDVLTSDGSPFYALLLRGDRKTSDTDAILPLLTAK